MPSSAPRCLGCGGQVLQRARALLKSAPYQSSRRADRFAQFFRHGERHQEVRHGQQPGALVLPATPPRRPGRSADRPGDCTSDTRSVPGRRRSGSVARPAPGCGTAGSPARRRVARAGSSFPNCAAIRRPVRRENVRQHGGVLRHRPLQDFQRRPRARLVERRQMQCRSTSSPARRARGIARSAAATRLPPADASRNNGATCAPWLRPAVPPWRAPAGRRSAPPTPSGAWRRVQRGVRGCARSRQPQLGPGKRNWDAGAFSTTGAVPRPSPGTAARSDPCRPCRSGHASRGWSVAVSRKSRRSIRTASPTRRPV